MVKNQRQQYTSLVNSIRFQIVTELWTFCQILNNVNEFFSLFWAKVPTFIVLLSDLTCNWNLKINWNLICSKQICIICSCPFQVSSCITGFVCVKIRQKASFSLTRIEKRRRRDGRPSQSERSHYNEPATARWLRENAGTDKCGDNMNIE